MGKRRRLEFVLARESDYDLCACGHYRRVHAGLVGSCKHPKWVKYDADGISAVSSERCRCIAYDHFADENMVWPR